MNFYVIRHGETDWNVAGKIQGKTDVELNNTGIIQAREAGEILKKYNIDLIISSPLKRTIKTAEIINEKINVPTICDRRLEERGCGELEGVVATSNIFYEEGLFNLGLNKDYKGVEKIQDVFSRIDELLKHLNKEYLDKNILLVTHGGVVRILNAYFNGLDENGDIPVIEFKNCQIKEFKKGN